MLALLRFVVLRHVSARPGRALFTALGVTLGVALYVAIALVNRATLGAFAQSVESLTGTAALTVLGGRTGFPSATVDKVRAVDGVSHAVGMVEMTAYYNAKDGSAKTISVLGIDLLNEAQVRSYKASNQEVIDDPLVFLNQPDSIIVTTGFASQNGLSLEDKLTLNTAFGIKQFTVRGMLSPEGPAKAHGGTLAIMDIDAAQFSFGREDTIDRIDVVVRTGVDVEDVRQRLARALGPAYRVEDPTGQTRALSNMVASFQGLLAVISALALLVAVFLVGNAVAIAVAERRREIGMLRALGVTRATILGAFLAEATLLGVLGAAAGILLGRGLASLMSNSVSMTMTTQLSTAVAVSEPRMGAREIAVGLAMGGATAFFAALVPSMRATRVHPLEAIRPTEPVTAGGGRRAIRVRVLGVALLAIVFVSSRLALAARWPAFDVIDPLCAVGGAVLAAPWFVDVLLRRIRPLAQRAPFKGRMVLRLACDNLIANPKRTGSNVMGLMVGLMLVVVISALSTSFKASLLTWFDQMLAADIFVSSAGNLASGGQVQPLHENVGKEIAEVPGVESRGGPVKTVSAMRVAHVRYGEQEIGIKAWDTPERPSDFAQFALRDGSREDSRALYEGTDLRALVSENFAMHFQKRRGDAIDIESPSGRRRFVIVGVVTDFANPVGIVYVTREAYKELWKDPLVTAFMVRVRPGHSVDEVRSALDARFGNRGLFTHTVVDLKRGVVRTIDDATATFSAIELTALVVALFGLLNTLLVSVMERYRELGTYRAIGMSRSQLAGLILMESILQGGLGGVAAALIGAYLSWAYLVGSLSRTMGFVLGYTFPWAAVMVAVLLGLAVAAIAGWLPARRATKLEITETLAHE
jgi:putative ABC transport system permease protein